MITFTDALLVGNAMIDTEHKMLFSIINDAHTQIEEKHCSIQNAMELIHNLENYAETHFAHEEAYMESISDPEYSIQKRAHNMFRAKISEYKGIDIANEEQAIMVLSEILEYLATWLYRHIIGSDTMIGKIPAMSEEEVADVFAFTGKYQSGIEFIDNEHKWLFELIHRASEVLHQADSLKLEEHIDNVMLVIDELGEYTQTHFAHEEEYMEAIKFPWLEDQRKAHESFVAKFEELNEEINQGNALDFLEDFIEFLLFWLTNHIYKSDLLIPYNEDVLKKML